MALFGDRRRRRARRHPVQRAAERPHRRAGSTWWPTRSPSTAVAGSRSPSRASTSRRASGCSCAPTTRRPRSRSWPAAGCARPPARPASTTSTPCPSPAPRRCRSPSRPTASCCCSRAGSTPSAPTTRSWPAWPRRTPTCRIVGAAVQRRAVRPRAPARPAGVGPLRQRRAGGRAGVGPLERDLRRVAGRRARPDPGPPAPCTGTDGRAATDPDASTAGATPSPRSAARSSSSRRTRPSTLARTGCLVGGSARGLGARPRPTSPSPGRPTAPSTPCSTRPKRTPTVRRRCSPTSLVPGADGPDRPDDGHAGGQGGDGGRRRRSPLACRRPGARRRRASPRRAPRPSSPATTRRTRAADALADLLATDPLAVHGVRPRRRRGPRRRRHRQAHGGAAGHLPARPRPGPRPRHAGQAARRRRRRRRRARPRRQPHRRHRRGRRPSATSTPWPLGSTTSS